MMFKSLLSAAAASLLAFNVHAEMPAEYLGIWKTDGYGQLFVIRNDGVSLLNITKDTCITEISVDNPKLIFFYYDLWRAGEQLVFAPNGAFGVQKADKLSELPIACQTPMPNTPESNFLTFSQNMQEYYGFFDLYGVNWPARVAAAQPKVTNNISEEALWSLLTQMLTGINDGHLALYNESNYFNPSIRQTQKNITDAVEKGELPADFTTDMLRGEIWQNSVPNTTLKGKGQTLLNGKLQYGTLSDDTGYVGVLVMYELVDSDNAEEQIAALHDAFDVILKNFAEKNITKVILDVSLNPGGLDGVSLAIASRFADKQRLAFTKRALEAKDKTPFEVDVMPSNRSRFTGDVYLLTSDMTVSAAEIFTLAMRALPTVKHAGQKTYGALSDSLGKVLPNGWQMSLSNELYLDAKGMSWEGKGIPPAINIPVFPRNDLLGGHAKAIETLLNRIQNPNQTGAKPVPSLSALGLLLLSACLAWLVHRIRVPHHTGWSAF